MKNTNSSVKYNFNMMRPAILHVREMGNRKAISKSIAEELGISETWFTCYTNIIEKLYKATVDYVRIKHSPLSTDEECTALREKIYPLWKNFLEVGEANDTIKVLRVREDDISSLIGYAEKFVNMENNLDLQDKFTSLKAIATNRLNAFQKSVETLLGIRMAEIEVLSEEEMDKLDLGRKFLSKRKKIQAAMDAAKEKKRVLEEILKTNKDEKTNSGLRISIESYNDTISSCEENLKENAKILQQIKNNTYKSEEKEA